MPIPTRGAIPVIASEPRTRTELILEGIALRHQIAVLKRNGTRRPRFTLGDRLFWILLSWWWPRWRESLMIVQPETVRRWRRNGWSGLWRHRSRGRWRGGRPRVSREVRELITRMARENFLWGAPRIHGELLMLGYKVSQSTLSRYLAISYRHPTSRGGRLSAIRRSPLVTGTIRKTPTRITRHSGPAHLATRSSALLVRS
jgi:hypothetical protein